MFSGIHDHTRRTRAKASHPQIPDVGQWAWELGTLVDIYKRQAPLVTVEIGVALGGTLAQWVKYAPQGALVVGIDDHPAVEVGSQRPGLQVHILTGNSHEMETFERLVQMLDGRLIDFLFIDADHSEAGATQDFEDYGPLVRSGGVIALHDILDPAPHRKQDHIRVSALWRRIRRAGYLTRELVTDPCQEWGGIGVVYV